MDNVGGLGDEHSSSTGLPWRKDQAGLGEPPQALDVVASFASGYSDPDCYHGILQADDSSPLAVLKDDGDDHHLSINGNNEQSEKLAERKNIFTASSVAATSGDAKNGLLKKIIAGEFRADDVVSAVDESEQSEAGRVSGAVSAFRRISLHVVETSGTFMPNQSLGNGALCGTGQIGKLCQQH